MNPGVKKDQLRKVSMIWRQAKAMSDTNLFSGFVQSTLILQTWESISSPHSHEQNLSFMQSFIAHKSC